MTVLRYISGFIMLLICCFIPVSCTYIGKEYEHIYGNLDKQPTSILLTSTLLFVLLTIIGLNFIKELFD